MSFMCTLLAAHGLLSLALPHGPARVVTPWGSELRAARKSAGRAAVIWLAAHRADLVLPTSAAVAAEMIERYRVPASRTQVLPWGVSRNPDCRPPVDLPQRRPERLPDTCRRDRCALGP